jgi:hypothetical protein
LADRLDRLARLARLDRLDRSGGHGAQCYVPRRSGHELPAYLGPFEEEQAAGTLQFLFEDRDLLSEE